MAANLKIEGMNSSSRSEAFVLRKPWENFADDSTLLQTRSESTSRSLSISFTRVSVSTEQNSKLQLTEAAAKRFCDEPW